LQFTLISSPIALKVRYFHLGAPFLLRQLLGLDKGVRPILGRGVGSDQHRPAAYHVLLDTIQFIVLIRQLP
jgi:hypothetical protein